MDPTVYTPYRCKQVLETAALVEEACIQRNDQLILALPDTKPCYRRRIRNFRDLTGLSLAEYCARRRITEILKKLPPETYAKMAKTAPYAGISRFKTYAVKHLGADLQHKQDPLTPEDLVVRFLSGSSCTEAKIVEAFEQLHLPYHSESKSAILRQMDTAQVSISQHNMSNVR